MTYEEKKFDQLLGLAGFSDTLLKNHFTLYAGYVKNVNALAETLQTAKPGTPEYAELKRRFGWEWNGMRLHELYFGNMTKDDANKTTTRDSAFEKAFTASFGTFESWLADFKATGAMRGIGWVILAFDPEAKRLFNVWINEHDVGHLAGAVSLLVMDVFEHAYMTDYGIKKADYIESFLKAIDWKVVEKRLGM
ncbi:MAG: superoxide dismutase [Patescibacteria group bacterium]|nr:superoxide dismutase [Patescibacteria group bacterium]MDE1945900.1 superoxide dismutase [Patescibacteria group bacterium]